MPSIEGQNSFKCNIVKKDRDIIVTFKGTHETKDWYNDLQLPISRVPSQFKTAELIIGKIKKNPEFENCNIILTGLS